MFNFSYHKTMIGDVMENLRVTIFGDSIPKGIATKDGKIERLQNNVVSIVIEKLGIDAENISVYGQTLSRFVEKEYIDKYISKLNSDYINVAIISLGGNDADYDWKNVASSPDVDHLSKTPLDKFELLLESTVKKLKANGVKVILTTIPPVDSQKYFDNVICKIADGNAVLKFFKGDVQNIYRHQESYNYAIIRVAQKQNCQLFDVRSAFLQDRAFLSKLCEDGIHPNEYGHAVMAEEILKQLEKII